jgi:hypothetical protein
MISLSSGTSKSYDALSDIIPFSFWLRQMPPTPQQAGHGGLQLTPTSKTLSR